MRLKCIIIGCVTLLTFSCGKSEIEYVVFESDLNSLFEDVEVIDSQLDELISRGGADKSDLLELKKQINELQEEMQTVFIEEDDVEPSHLRR